jgi:hypothetical protein
VKCAGPTLIAVAAAALLGAAHAQTVAEAAAPSTGMLAAEQQYLRLNGSRFAGFAGSAENLEALVLGLRRGEPIGLSDGTQEAHFAPPTRPMGYGNVTRALDLARRQLAAAGIDEPTPQEIKAAMLGGTVSGPDGDVTLQGVLTLRSEGMGWGKIARVIGVHPGLGSSKPAATGSAVSATFATQRHSAAAASAAGITTAAGAGARPQRSARATLARGAGGHGSALSSGGTLQGKGVGSGHGSGHGGGKR